MINLEWVDVSMPLRNGMLPCPHGIQYLARRVSDVAKLHTETVSVVWMGSHTGTHIDAPAHLLSKGLTIDHMPLNATVGPALVAELPFDDGAQARLGVEDLERISPEPAGRLLVKTHGRSLEVTETAAAWLAARKLRSLGTESYLVNDAVRGQQAKRLLLGANIWVIEELDLEHVEAGRYELVCLPLKLAGGDAAPARALLRRL
jgi:arylformamidase